MHDVAEDVFLPTLLEGEQVEISNQELPRFEDLSDPIHKRMRTCPYYGQRIILRSVYGKTAGPCQLEPTHAKGNDLAWLGIPQLTPSEAKRGMYPPAIPGTTYKQITDGFEVDLGTEKGLYDWEWMQYCPQIVQHREETDYNPEKPWEGAEAEYYIVVPNFEEERQARQYDERRQALNYVHGLSPAAWYQLARLLGANMENSKPHSVYNYLQGIADKKPERIMLAKNEENAHVRLLFLKLFDAGIIKKDLGVYKYNEKALGTDEKQVVYNMCTKEMASIVRFMRNDLGVRTLGLPVDSPYASYGSTSVSIKDQASQPSSVLAAVAQRAQPVTTAFTEPTELDDYVEDEADAVHELSDAPGVQRYPAPSILAPQAPAPPSSGSAPKRNTSGLRNHKKD